MTQHIWQCVGYGPTGPRWVLGTQTDNKMTDIVSVAERNPDGSWKWMTAADCLGGTEPSRLLAMQAAERAITINDLLEYRP